MRKILVIRSVAASACTVGWLIVAPSLCAEPSTPGEEAPVVMEALKVDADFMPKLSFGISLDVWKDNNTKKVLSIAIRDVKAGSQAEEKGLAPRVRIERIDGKLVQEFSASFLPGSELNRIFVNRRNGDEVILEITVLGERESRTVTLVERRNLGITLPSVLERVK